MFLGEILGAVILGGNEWFLKTLYTVRNLGVVATGMLSKDGQITIDENGGDLVRVLESVDPLACYYTFATQLGDEKQSSVIGSFEMQRRMWTSPHK